MNNPNKPAAQQNPQWRLRYVNQRMAELRDELNKLKAEREVLRAGLPKKAEKQQANDTE